MELDWRERLLTAGLRRSLIIGVTAGPTRSPVMASIAAPTPATAASNHQPARSRASRLNGSRLRLQKEYALSVVEQPRGVMPGHAAEALASDAGTRAHDERRGQEPVRAKPTRVGVHDRQRRRRARPAMDHEARARQVLAGCRSPAATGFAVPALETDSHRRCRRMSGYRLHPE